LTRYLKAPILQLESDDNDKFDVLAWWRGNEKEYPMLAKVAFDVFCIPAMSVEPERVFSGYYLIIQQFDSRCKLSLTDGRNRLNTDILEAIECLRSWLGGKKLDNILQGISMEDLMDESI
jgi:hAT family dimerisation domain.